MSQNGKIQCGLRKCKRWLPSERSLLNHVRVSHSKKDHDEVKAALHDTKSMKVRAEANARLREMMALG